jgi:hypothetical protein
VNGSGTHVCSDATRWLLWDSGPPTRVVSAIVVATAVPDVNVEEPTDAASGRGHCCGQPVALGAPHAMTTTNLLADARLRFEAASPGVVTRVS